MVNNLSLGPVQIFTLETASVNGALRDLSERIDALKGLRGRTEIWDRTRVDDPTQAQDALTLGAAARQYGEIYAYDVAGTITIAASGIANKVQIDVFDTDGESTAEVVPDHTNDHLTVGQTGPYFVACSIAAESVAGAAALFGWGCWVNNGATQLANLHAHRQLSGGGSDRGSISLSGIAALTATDTLEVWTYNETNTQNVVVDDITLSAIYLGQ